MPKQRTVSGAPSSPSPRSTDRQDRRRRITGAIARPDTIAVERAQMVRAGEHGSFSDDHDRWVESGPSAAYVFLYRT